jgi:type III secretion system FlhB-like substrate exporter
MARAEKAAALRYTEDLPAPIVVAAGKGALAALIKKIAKENGVVLVENPELADTLLSLEVGSLIPESLYAVIAEILAFVRTLGSKR